MKQTIFDEWGVIFDMESDLLKIRCWDIKALGR